MPHLRFDINAMAALEEVTGEKSFLTIVNNKEKMASFRMLRALYWAGTDTKASLEEAGEKLSEELMEEWERLHLFNMYVQNIYLKSLWLIQPFH